MPYSVVDVLEKSSLSTTKGVQECQVAAMTLLKTVEELDKSAAKGEWGTRGGRKRRGEKGGSGSHSRI